MTIDNVLASPKWGNNGKASTLGAMGAAERRLWSSFVRQGEIGDLVSVLHDPAKYGVAVVGPWGVGKTTLARAVASSLAETTHIVQLYGSPADTLLAYGPLAVLMARLPVSASLSPLSIIHGIDELIRGDAGGKSILLVVDDLPSLDPMTVGVIMHLLLSRTAKIMVLARELNDLPEDLVWLVKDKLLCELRLSYFNRAEVGELISKATGTLVSESAVTALFNASSGVPLILQAIFQEQVTNGNLNLRRGVWVVAKPLDLESSSALAEIVRSRLARESPVVRLGIEKMALLGRAPLSAVLAVLGQESLSILEARGFLEISSGDRHQAYLSEPYIGDIVRGWLSPGRLAELFDEIATKFGRELGSLDAHETMSLAAWTLDAGLVLNPQFGLSAAALAIQNFDPLLALRCTSQVPAEHPLRTRAVEMRGAAYRMMAEYERAVAEFETVAESVVDTLGIADYGSWIHSMTGALLWVPGGYQRAPELIADASLRLDRVGAESSHADIRNARSSIRLAHFEHQVHCGEFEKIIDELTAASHDEDAEFALNCACLLVPTLAVVGREMESITLGRRLRQEIDAQGVSVRFAEYCWDGLTNALIWSGQWLECVDLLRQELEGTPQPFQYGGGLTELKLGLAYAYAGRGAEAVAVLMAAAAQLEVRQSNNTLGLAYIALAFAYAQDSNEEEAVNYLALAETVDGPTLWSNRAMAKFLRLVTLRWLDDGSAVDGLRESALIDIEKHRFSTASMSLFGGTVHGADKDYALLEEVSLRRQGPMATINVLLARSARTRDPNIALEAAAMAQELKLDAVESRCAVLALNFATEKGLRALAQEARHLLERSKGSLVKLPVLPQTEGARLTHRELQVARLAKRGLGNRAIADRIGVSVRTVEGHLYQVYIKLGIATRLELEQGQEI